MKQLEKSLADKLVGIAIQQFKVGYNFKKSRLNDIRKNEEFYYGRKINVPKGRFGVPLPVMAGFVDTLMSKVDDPPTINFGYKDLADLKISQKVSSAWNIESSSTRENWPMKDRWAKKLACFSGRAISKIYAESDPKYRNHLEVVDYEDFVSEPMGGGDLERHLFCGQDGIFRSRAELLTGIENGLYEPKQARMLVTALKDKNFKKNEDIYRGKAERMRKLGLDLNANLYVGQPILKFVEWAMDYDGERYYLLFDYQTGIWIRAHKLKEVFTSNLYPWESWATHEDAFNFWSKAPCDDVRPIADAMDTLWNQALDNRQKKNYGQRGYDPDMFPDPSELEWRPDGLVRIKGAAKGKDIRTGIYEFQTPEVVGTIDLLAFMDNFLGRKTGITPEIQGQPEEQKVGIYFGNLQQVADRLGLYNKSYRECWSRMGLKYAWGAYDHLTEPMMVKIIGESGVEWDELTHGEAKKAPDLDIEISGGTAEMMANESKAKKRENALVMLNADPELRAMINPRWRIQEILKHGSFEEAEIRTALSKESGNIELLSEATQSIQQILKGKVPKINRGANTAFIQKIVDFAVDSDVAIDIYKKLMGYAQAHVKIAVENMTRMAMVMGAGGGQPIVKKGVLPLSEQTVVEEPVPGTPGGTLSTSLKASNILRGKSPIE